jgi:hypothetical protein
MAQLSLRTTDKIDLWGDKITAGEIYFTIIDNTRFFITLRKMVTNESRWWKVLYYDTKKSSVGTIEDVWISPNVYEKAI